MGMLLLVVGMGWALLGTANLLMMPWSTMQSHQAAAGLAIMVNVLLFILPGLIVAGIGAGIRRRKDTSRPVESPKSMQERLAQLDQFKAAALISEEEYRSKRAEILGKL